MNIQIKAHLLYLIKPSLALLAFTYISCVNSVHAEEVETQKTVLPTLKIPEKTKQTNTLYIIETRVQGSQEQPNVIYITPWQENEKAVSIQGQSLRVLLPQLAPINPKHFKKQLINYYQKQAVNER